MSRISLKKFFLFLIFTLFITNAPDAYAQSSKWVAGYYADWHWWKLKPADIDYDGLTHIIHFSVWPRNDGTIDLANIAESHIQPLVDETHAAGKKIIISIGGANPTAQFRSAMSDANYITFANNLVQFMTTHGYDGIDIDMENIANSDHPDYIRFIKELRSQLDVITPRPLLLVAAQREFDLFSQLVDEFDQINFMSYDLAGAWPGWVTWHNSAIKNGGQTFPSNSSKTFPDIHEYHVEAAVAAGIPREKIGIGVDFYGYVWKGGSGTDTGGVTKPAQSWSSPPVVIPNVAYYNIIKDYGTEPVLWDDVAEAAYISIDNSGSADDRFISLDDERAMEAKVDYMHEENIGGMIIWELGGGILANNPPGQQDPLMTAIKNRMATYTNTTVSVSHGPTSPTTADQVTFTATGSLSSTIKIYVNDVLVKTATNATSTSYIGGPYSAGQEVEYYATSEDQSNTARDPVAGSKSFTVVSPDNTNPTVGISSPTNGQTLSGSPVTVSGTASDNPGGSGISAVNVRVNGGSWETATGQTSWSIDVVLAGGANTIEAKAIDGAGNESSVSSISVTLEDAQAPQVTITEPANGSQVSGSVTISADASDNVGVVGVQFYVDGVAEGAEDTSSPYSINWTTTPGNHTLTAVVRDDANNQITSTPVIVSVPSAPTMVVYDEDLNSPWVNASWNLQSVDFVSSEEAFNGSKALKVVQQAGGAVSLRGGAWGEQVALDPGPYENIEMAVHGGPSGMNLEIWLEYRDNSGQIAALKYTHGAISANQWTEVAVPMLTINPNSLEFERIDIMDISGNQVTYYIDEVRFTPYVNEQGPDTTPPTVNIATPADNSEVSGNVTITAVASDNVGVVGVKFFVDDTLIDSEDTTSPYSVTWNSSSVSVGDHILTAVARDAVGNQTTSSDIDVEVIGSNPSGPTVNIIAPSNGSNVSGNVTIIASASDNIGVAGVKFYVDGNLIGSEDTSSPYSVTWNSSTVADGAHSLTAVARDTDDLETTSSSVEVNVSSDNGPPQDISVTLYDDTLISPWSDSSWGMESLDYDQTDLVYDGGKAIKLEQKAWGALSIRTTETLEPLLYESLQFAVHGGDKGVRLRVYARNDQGNDFPSVKYGKVPAKKWTMVTIPMAALSPDGHGIDQLYIQDETGRPLRTYYIDAIECILINAQQLNSTVPQVAITSPSDSSEVTGIITLSADISDDNGLVGVEFLINGSFLSADSTVAPVARTSNILNSPSAESFSTAWNTSTVALPNGTHHITAVGIDVDGNRTTSSVMVTVNANGLNANDEPITIYDEKLELPWIDASWGLDSINFFNTSTAHTGTKSIRVNQQAFGAMGMHSSAWQQPEIVDPSEFEALQFSINGGENGIRLRVFARSEFEHELPGVKYGDIPANQWVSVSIKMSDLSPNGYSFDQIYFQDDTGNSLVTFYLDNIQLIPKDSQPKSNVQPPFVVYDDKLSLSQVDVSENLTIDFNNTSPVYTGLNSMRIVQSSNGQLGFFNTESLDPNRLESVQFAVHGGLDGIDLQIYVTNSEGDTFPVVDYGLIPANSWTVVRVPMSDLNPDNIAFNRVFMLDEIGTPLKTFYVDDFKVVYKELPTAIEDEQDSNPAPSTFSLSQNAPNPFNPTTSITYELPQASQVSLVIFNMLGQEVRTLVNTLQPAGLYSVQWDGRNRTGLSVSSGVYFYRIQTKDFIDTKRMTLLK